MTHAEFRQLARKAPCFCRGYDPADPCMHSDTSQGCPRHDPTAFAEWIDAMGEGDFDCGYALGINR